MESDDDEVGDDEQVVAILDDLEAVADRALTPDDVQDLKRALFEEPAAFSEVLYSENSYFVIGSYNNDEEQRLVSVKQLLAERRPDDHAFLMKDIPEFTQNFALKFHVLSRRSDYVVGVFEHNRGGHEWEAGALSSPPLRAKTWAAKRAYETESDERDAFDAMIAHFFELLAERGRLLEWTTDEELHDRVRTDVP